MKHYKIIHQQMKRGRHFIGLLLLMMIQLITLKVSAQTEMDAIMMNKTQFCAGFMYNHSSWDTYWEGKLKRTNENLGTVTSQNIMFMANYGITNDLNVMVGLPYVWTEASAGTLHGMEGFQDFSLHVKWRALKKDFGKDKLSLFLIGGVSTPTNDYVIDFLPLSIGLGSSNVTGRVMVDYIRNRIFATASAAYVMRSNVTIDRTSYYDTEMHNTNEVSMPDAMNYQLRAGYRGKYLIAEALFTGANTLGGFDMTRNNMPFPSNEMNSTAIGFNLKYTMPFWTNLSVLGGYNQVIDGRNAGRASMFNAGVFYALYFNKKYKPVQFTQ